MWQSRGLMESAAMHVHAFVTSCIDYCNVLLVGAPKATIDKLQHLLNAVARLVSDTRKFVAACACQPSFSRRTGVSEVQTRVDGA